MTVDRDLILKLEQLAKLELTEEERTKMIDEFGKILTMVEKLQELDTEGVEPLVYVNEAFSKWRADKVENQVSQQEALKNAPDTDGTYFKLPKVLHND